MNYLEPFIGGVLIGLGSLLAMAGSGKVPGISGVAARILRPHRGDTAWRVVFLLGLIGGATIIFQTSIGWQALVLPGGRNATVIGIAAFLVGFGARMGGGCTSGHGVCGMGSGARDAMVYTVVFMATGAATVFLWNLLMLKGGAPS